MSARRDTGPMAIVTTRPDPQVQIQSNLQTVAAPRNDEMGLGAQIRMHPTVVSIGLNQHFRRNRQLLVQCSNLLHRKPPLAMQDVMDALS